MRTGASIRATAFRCGCTTGPGCSPTGGTPTAVGRSARVKAKANNDNREALQGAKETGRTRRAAIRTEEIAGRVGRNPQEIDAMDMHVIPEMVVPDDGSGVVGRLDAALLRTARERAATHGRRAIDELEELAALEPREFVRRLAVTLHFP